jgi:hypothetical protein
MLEIQAAPASSLGRPLFLIVAANEKRSKETRFQSEVPLPRLLLVVFLRVAHHFAEHAHER